MVFVECVGSYFSFVVFCYSKLESGQRGPAHLPAGDIGLCFPVLLCLEDDHHSHVRDPLPTSYVTLPFPTGGDVMHIYMLT